jgi:hypothetical protein
LRVSHRPLVFVSGLSVGDYLLWNWSLAGNHGVLALVSGLTLPPLAALCVALIALSLARLIAHTARRPSRRAAQGGGERIEGTRRAARETAPAGVPLAEPPATTTTGGRSTSKIAA